MLFGAETHTKFLALSPRLSFYQCIAGTEVWFYWKLCLNSVSQLFKVFIHLKYIPSWDIAYTGLSCPIKISWPGHFEKSIACLTINSTSRPFVSYACSLKNFQDASVAWPGLLNWGGQGLLPGGQASAWARRADAILKRGLEAVQGPPQLAHFRQPWVAPELSNSVHLSKKIYIYLYIQWNLT